MGTHNPLLNNSPRARQVGTGLPLSLGVSVLAIVMGLNLLEVLLLPLPTLDLDTRKLGLPVAMQVCRGGGCPSLLQLVQHRSSSVLRRAETHDQRRFTLQAYAAGAVFALAASPCSTPVLATLIAFVSSTGDPMQVG